MFDCLSEAAEGASGMEGARARPWSEVAAKRPAESANQGERHAPIEPPRTRLAPQIVEVQIEAMELGRAEAFARHERVVSSILDGRCPDCGRALAARTCTTCGAAFEIS